MSRKLAKAILLTVSYVRQHPQFIFTLLLILLIPVAFLYSGQQFLKVANSNVEKLELERVGLLQDVLSELVVAHEHNYLELQSSILSVTDRNPDFTKLRIVEEVNGQLTVIAAKDDTQIGEAPQNAAIFKTALLNEGESYTNQFPGTYSQDRFWQTFRAVRTDSGLYYIFTEIQFGLVDSLFEARKQEAYIVLALVLMAVLFLAYRHIRLIDYGYLYKRADEAVKTRDLFTNMVTHELRAPLTAIRGYASMISENDSLDVKTRDEAIRIEQSSQRLLLIVNDLLEVARLQSGKLKINREQTDVCDVVRNVLNALEGTAAEKHISLSHDLGDVSCRITSDGKRLHQVLTNLVSNAIKYTQEGKILVVLEDKGSDINVRVQDTGMGIEAADQKRLFAPFFRVENDDVSQITGTGLGMWITKQLVVLLGGEIGVESIKGVGTHVVVTLPKDTP